MDSERNMRKNDKEREETIREGIKEEPKEFCYQTTRNIIKADFVVLIFNVHVTLLLEIEVLQ